MVEDRTLKCNGKSVHQASTEVAGLKVHVGENGNGTIPETATCTSTHLQIGHISFQELHLLLGEG